MDFIDRYLTELESVVHRISRDQIRSVVDVLMNAWRASRTVYVIGNGGSAATASHMMNDLNKYTVVEGLPRFRCVALTDNVPLMAAYANDQSFADVFVEPLRNLLQRDDVLIAISTSGKSPNVLKAVEFARDAGAVTVGFCGPSGGRLAELANTKIAIPAERIGQQEDGHLILNHVIAAALHERLTEVARTAVRASVEKVL